MRWKILKNEQDKRYCYQTAIRNGFRKKIFQKRYLASEDLKLGDILFHNKIGSVGGEEENTVDVTFDSEDFTQKEGFYEKEKEMIVFFRGKTEEGQYINTEHIEKGSCTHQRK